MTALFLLMDGTKAESKNNRAMRRHPAEIGRMKKILRLPLDRTRD
jgi:hypothetical protein